MTLIEILIVLAIIGLMVLLLPGVIKGARKSDLRADAARIAAAMRWGYDRAASTASHHRLVIDLDKDEFWVERCEGIVKMVRTPDEAHAEEEQAIIAQAAKPPEPPPDLDLTAIASGAPPANPTVPTLQVAGDVGSDAAPLPCTPVKGAAGKHEPLAKKSGISIKEVFVSHLEKPADSGRVTINFFPLGRGERALVTLTDADEHIYTVRLHAITGRAQVIEGEYRHAEGILEQAETEGTR